MLNSYWDGIRPLSYYLFYLYHGSTKNDNEIPLYIIVYSIMYKIYQLYYRYSVFMIKFINPIKDISCLCLI